MANVFFSYSHKDEALRDELEVHLAMLKREGAISAWHDRKTLAGNRGSEKVYSPRYEHCRADTEERTQFPGHRGTDLSFARQNR